MKEAIYLVMYVITEIVNYEMAYTTIFEMEIEKNKRKWLIGLGILAIIHILLYKVFGIEMSRNFSMFSMIIVPLFCVKGIKRRKIALYPITLILIASIGACFSFVMSMIINVPEREILNNIKLTLICQIVPIVMMSILTLYRFLKNYRKIQLQLDAKQYFLFYVGIICIYFLIATLQQISKEGVTERMVNYYGMSTSVVCIILILLIIWQGIMTKRETEYVKQNEMYDMYMKMQEEQIKTLIEHDNRIKSFKHDINNHFIALCGYAEMGNNEDIKEYLRDMKESSMMSQIVEYTSNGAIDAIIRQMVEIAKMQDIDIKVTSSRIEEVGVSIFDLCTIVSNVIKNAIEGCEKITNQKRKVNVCISKYEDSIYICVENTIKDKVNIADNILISTKKDKENHGIGSNNVRKTVEKYGGIINYKNEEKSFIVEIII